jgi:hypothetical protein
MSDASDERADAGTAASPQLYARVAGILYLVIIVAALLGVYTRGELIVRGDAAATASNIIAHETLFRFGLAGELLTCLCDVAVAGILYLLTRPVSRGVALLAAFNRLTFAAVFAVSKLFIVAATVVLGGEDFMQAFSSKELQALAYLSLRMHGLGYGLSLIFFGVHCVLLGWLVYRSGYLPRTIGVLLVAGGVGYFVHSLIQSLDPELALTLFPWIILPAIPAELGLTLWLLLRGIDVPRWQEAIRNECR